MAIKFHPGNPAHLGYAAVERALGPHVGPDQAAVITAHIKGRLDAVANRLVETNDAVAGLNVPATVNHQLGTALMAALGELEDRGDLPAGLPLSFGVNVQWYRDGPLKIALVDLAATDELADDAPAYDPTRFPIRDIR